MPEVRVSVRVRPGSSRIRVGGSYGLEPHLVVAVNAPPVDGAANAAVLAAVADAFGVRPRTVRVVSGHTARTKVLSFDVDDAEQFRVLSRLRELLDQ